MITGRGDGGGEQFAERDAGWCLVGEAVDVGGERTVQSGGCGAAEACSGESGFGPRAGGQGLALWGGQGVSAGGRARLRAFLAFLGGWACSRALAGSAGVGRGHLLT